MKQTPELNKIQLNMAPGKITQDGFLGDDKRNLVDILIEDEAIVKRAGFTHELLAKRMRYFLDKGASGQGFFEDIPPHFEAKVEGVRGGLPCPFDCGHLIPKNNITVKNLKKNSEIIYTELSIHLIEKHGFYQGKNAFFRLNPKEIIKVLEP